MIAVASWPGRVMFLDAKTRACGNDGGDGKGCSWCTVEDELFGPNKRAFLGFALKAVAAYAFASLSF